MWNNYELIPHCVLLIPQVDTTTKV